MTMYGKISLRILFAAMLATALMLAVTASPASAATEARGVVQCKSGAKVVGIWIDAKNGGSGWAKFSPKFIPRIGNVSTVNFNRTLPNGGMYRVKVGCGGTSQQWKTSITSPFVKSNKSHWFTCHDYTAIIPKWCDVR